MSVDEVVCQWMKHDLCDVFCRSRSGTLLATGRSESKCSAGFTNADVKVGTLRSWGGGEGGATGRSGSSVWLVS